MPGAKIRNRKIIPPKKAYCEKGHEIFRYLLVPYKGRKKLQWACECTLKPMAVR